jgi:CRISPR system Cascade subunit CasE
VTPQLHLVRLELNPSRVFDFGAHLRLPQGTDLGYLVHCQLGTLFGECSLTPFVIEDTKKSRNIIVQGYSTRSGEELREYAQTFSDPRAFEACDWTTFASKPMPMASVLKHGMQLGFATRVHPVKRTRSGERTLSEQELPAWVTRELSRNGAATLNVVKVSPIRLIPMTRRTQGVDRQIVCWGGPEVHLEGAFTVRDPESFQMLLLRGVGRQHAFGFGMLRLRSAR